MIGNTLVETHLKKALTLDDALAWYEANTRKLKNWCWILSDRISCLNVV